MRCQLIIAALFPGLALAARAQQPLTFHASSQLVVEAVTVTNKTGHVIAGLTAQDFTITEDGVVQTVAFCNFQKLLTRTARQKSGAAGAAGASTATTSGYANRRLLVLYFDLTSMPPAGLLRALAAARQFIRQAQPADLIALYTFAGDGVKARQNFTANREVLGRALATIAEQEQQANGLGQANPAGPQAPGGSGFGEDATEFNLFNNDRELAALQTTVTQLAKLRQEKSLVYFNAGMRMNGVDNQAQLQATVQAARAAEVRFFPIDTRGLVASAPLGDASQASPAGAALYNGEAVLERARGQMQQRSALYALAGDTGGRAQFDSNDLAAGIVRAERAITDYYILGYYTSHTEQNGQRHRIRITLPRHPAASLAYRNNYYAPKSFAQFSQANKERQLQEALALGNPITQLRLALATSYFQLNQDEYYVPIAVKIPGAELAPALHRGASTAHLDFIGEIKDGAGMTVTNFRDHMDVELAGDTAAQLRAHPLEYISGVTLLPGTYSLKFLARDAQTGHIGTFLTPLSIPNLNDAKIALPISGVVLGSQRIPLSAALSGAAEKKQLAVNPLVAGGEELLPSITRVFHLEQPMFVYLQAYEPGSGPMQPLAVYPSFYQDGKLVYAAPALAVRLGLQAHSRAVPVRLALSLNRLPPGEYTLQLSVIAPETNQAAFWRGRVSILP